jgi:histone H3/H4
MPKKIEFVRFNTVKDYIKDAHKMRSNEAAVNDLTARFNSLIEAVITEAAKLAKERKRNTILSEDAKAALEKLVGKKHLDWQELLNEVLLQNPIDLGKISKGIDKWIEEQKQK